MSNNLSITYLLDYWEDVFSGVSSKRDLLKIFNPRVVIREVPEEITLNKINNKANEDFFRRSLGGYLKNDPASQYRLKPYLQMMTKEFDLAKHRPRYLPQLCHSALKVFEGFEYFEDCIEAIVSIVVSNNLSEANKANIKILSNNLIVEFREIGYTDKDIREFMKDVFSIIQVFEGNIIWKYPHNIECENWDDQSSVEKYNKSLFVYQSELTDIERIRGLLCFAKKEKKLVRYIFKVNGMVGTEELEVGDVLFYPPSLKKLCIPHDGDFDEDRELFRNHGDKSLINATIFVKELSQSSGELIARREIEKTLAICRRAMPSANRLWLNKSHLRLDENNKKIGSSWHAFERSDDDFNRVFSLDSVGCQGIKKTIEKLQETRKVAEENNWGKRFDEASYWLRRADESDHYVDKLLSYWICIESLCAKSEDERVNWISKSESQKETDIFLVREIVGKVRAVSKCYEHGWMIYNYLSNCINLPFYKAIRTIPQELLEKSQLTNKNETVYLRNFVDACEDIAKYVNGHLLKEQIEEVAFFYKDKKEALNVLRFHLDNAQDEIAFIYRMRNKIAHDGNNDHPLLPSICNIAQEYASSLFSYVSRKVTDEGARDIDKILIMAVQQYDFMELQLQTKKPIEIFFE